MRISATLGIAILTTLVLSFSSCSEETEELTFEPVNNYIPLQKGKYITYRIDSLVTTSFNAAFTTNSYQVKHVIDEQITDNLGRPSYRVYRYLNNADASGQWEPNGSYLITPLENKIELIEDNLRFIKLHSPIREDYSWKGNAYLPADAYEPFGYAFGNDNNMQKWDFTYTAPESSFTYKGITYSNVQTVEQQDYSLNIPVTPSVIVATRNRSVEKYAKDIGLVYREYTLWEYQANPSGPAPAYTGFGITMWMVDHN